jgi:Xaa-Pro dipeptidase
MLINERRASDVMDAAGLDGLVGTRLENLFYLSGIYNVNMKAFPYELQNYAVVSRDKLTSPLAVVSTGDWDQSKIAFPGLSGTVTFGTFTRELPAGVELTALERDAKSETIDRKPRASALDALIVALEELGLSERRVGIDQTVFNPVYWAQLSKRLPKLTAVPAADVFRTIRMVKTPNEIERLRHAALVTERAIHEALGTARAGTTERELARHFRRSISEQDGEPVLAMFRFGRNGAFGQIPPDETALKPGDIIWLDVACKVGGYWADLARVFCLGEPSLKLRTYYDAVLAGARHGMAVTRPGITAEGLFDETLKVVKKSGIPHYQRHHVGHGIGLEIYDAPLIAPGQTDVIESGMVLNVETPYYEIGFGAVHIEDPFVVGENGNELLTAGSRELGIIPH